MNEIDDCKRILKDRKYESLAGEGFTTKTVKSGSGPLLSEAVLYCKEALAFLKKQMAMSSLQDGFFSSPNVPEGTGHPGGTYHGQET